MGTRRNLSFCACKTAWLAPELLVSLGSSLICGFCMQNSVLRAKIACLYESQSSPVIFCMQISDFSTWNTSLYWSQPSSVVFACKTATFGPAYKSLWVPDITCRFVHAKQRDEHLNYQSLCVPALICGFCMQNSAFWTRITSLHGSQTSSVVFACKTATFGPAYKSLWVPDITRCFVLAKQRD